jgi:hypothetical protein
MNDDQAAEKSIRIADRIAEQKHELRELTEKSRERRARGGSPHPSNEKPDAPPAE